MPIEVGAVVLLGALFNASWNALVRFHPDKFGIALRLTLAAGVLGALLAALRPLPPADAWPYIAISVLLHVFYYFAVAGIYRLAPLSLAYPLMRGLPPLLVAALAVLLFDEWPAVAGALAVVAICAGVLTLVLEGARRARLDGRGLAAVVGVALLIAAFTLNDAAGARAARDPMAYVGWVHVLLAPVMLAYGVRRRHRFAADARLWGIALACAACSIGAYLCLTWALARAPVAYVAALRECGVLFSLLIAWFLLGERFGAVRVAAAAMVVAGAALMKLA